MSRPAPSFRALALTLVLAIAASGCGDDDEPTAASSTTTPSAAEEPSDDGIAVTAVDYRYRDLPDEAGAGTTFRLRNGSDAEVHELVALRLADDEARSIDDLLALPPGELEALFAAPPAMVLIAPPGEDGFAAVGTGRLTDPGRYLIACFIPTGADPQAYLSALDQNPGVPPDVPGGPPHFAVGMAQQLTVR